MNVFVLAVAPFLKKNIAGNGMADWRSFICGLLNDKLNRK